MKWVMRTGLVRVASSRGGRIYGSLDDMPHELRERAREALAGENSDTILIADPEAYERIVKSGEELPAELQRFRTASRREEPRRDEGLVAADREWKVMLGGGVLGILGLWALWLWAARSGMP